jgi:hypothetical protein
MSNLIQQLLKSKDLTKFCDAIKQHALNNGARLCGVDYCHDRVSFKLYVELMSIPDKQCIKQFLSNESATSFVDYCKHWDSSRKSGLAFGIKVDTLGNTRSYYHIKFKQSFVFDEVYSQLVFLKLLGINASMLAKGISAEVDSNNNFVIKHYYYVTDKTHIAKVLSYKKFAIKDIDLIRELEIYATKTKHKINIIYNDDGFKVDADVWEHIPDKYKKQVTQDIKTLGSDPSYVGRTSDDVLSVYYSLTNKSNNILNI